MDGILFNKTLIIIYLTGMKSKIIRTIFLIISFINNNVNAQVVKYKSTFSQPKLVVGIVVDQMRSDYIYRYWNKLSDDGFKRLIREGFECKNTQYNYMPTYTGPGHASIYTGTTPSQHGIIGNNWFDASLKAYLYCVTDTSVHSIDGLGGQFSPKNLLTTTIGDELRLFSNFRSKVIGVSLKDRASILPAGKSGMAYWLDENYERFITSSYYIKGKNNSLPEWVSDFNNRRLPQMYLDSVWRPLFDINTYTESTPDNNVYEEVFDTASGAKPVFDYNLKKLRLSNHDLLRQTPFGNTLLKEFAIAAIEGENLGSDSICDMLLVSFSSTDYVGHAFATHAVETEDTYLRLDRELAAFLKYLDKKVGKNNYLVVLTADHGALPNPVFLNDHQLPGGYIEAKMMSDTIKHFFRMNYQSEAVFRSYINDQVYLNDSLIKVKNLDKQNITLELGRFLMKLDIVADVVSRSQLENAEFNSGPRNLVQHGFNYKRSGDLAVIFKAGFIQSYTGKKGTTHGSAYKYDTSVPLLWYGWNVQHGNSARSINITDIAATLSIMLNICQPSGCEGKPILEVIR